MDETITTLINIAFYIIIFRFIGGMFRKKKPQKQTGAPGDQAAEEQVVKTERKAEKKKKTKKKESFFEEAMKQLKKLEELAKEADDTKEKKPKKRQREQVVAAEAPVVRERMRSQAVAQTKENNEKNLQVYYNKTESADRQSAESPYRLRAGELRKAIVYSEIIGPPVSKRPGIPGRR